MSSLVDLIQNAISVETENIHTCVPGKFLSYDYKTQKCSVQPLLRKVYIEKTAVNLPVIENVPVVFPRSSSAGITFPIHKGDKCLIIFCERSIDEWKSQGEISTPQDPRRYDLSDAIAIPGLFSFSDKSLSSNNTDVEIHNKSFVISLTGSGKVKIIGKSGFDLLKVLDEFFTQVKSLKVITGIGIQPLDPTSIANLQLVHNKLLELVE